jgi:hypothetical protein
LFCHLRIVYGLNVWLLGGVCFLPLACLHGIFFSSFW